MAIEVTYQTSGTCKYCGGDLLLSPRSASDTSSQFRGRMRDYDSDQNSLHLRCRAFYLENVSSVGSSVSEANGNSSVSITTDGDSLGSVNLQQAQLSPVDANSNSGNWKLGIIIALIAAVALCVLALGVRLSNRSSP